MKTGETLPFTSRQSRTELLLALLWLPVHLFALPRLLVLLFPQCDDSTFNLLCYGIGTGWMVLTQYRFLRRDFDPLCDRLGRVLLEVLISYGAMLLFNMGVNSLMMLLVEQLDNPNNGLVVEMARSSGGFVEAMAVFFAPLMEELIFRAGIFGGLRRKSRFLAYAVSMLLFAAYHVWGFALADPMVWVYVLQYLPVAFLLCRVYERTNTVWSCILMHMLVNFVALKALDVLQKLL